MIKFRCGAFETNSSSSHSLNLTNYKKSKDELLENLENEFKNKKEIVLSFKKIDMSSNNYNNITEKFFLCYIGNLVSNLDAILNSEEFRYILNKGFINGRRNDSEIDLFIQFIGDIDRYKKYADDIIVQGFIYDIENSFSDYIREKISSFLNKKVIIKDYEYNASIIISNFIYNSNISVHIPRDEELYFILDNENYFIYYPW